MKRMILVASASLACGVKIFSNESADQSLGLVGWGWRRRWEWANQQGTLPEATRCFGGHGWDDMARTHNDALALPTQNFNLYVTFFVKREGYEDNIMRWDSTEPYTGPWDEVKSRRKHHTAVLRVDADGKLCYGEYDGYTWMAVQDFEIKKMRMYTVLVKRTGGQVQMDLQEEVWPQGLQSNQSNNKVTCYGPEAQVQTDGVFRSLWKEWAIPGTDPVAMTLPAAIGNVPSKSDDVYVQWAKVSSGSLGWNSCFRQPLACRSSVLGVPSEPGEWYLNQNECYSFCRLEALTSDRCCESRWEGGRNYCKAFPVQSQYERSMIFENPVPALHGTFAMLCER